MTAAPPLPLVQALPVLSPPELATYMVDERYESFLTEVAWQIMRQQMQLDAQQQAFREQQQQLAQSASRLSLFETAFAQACSSRGQTPAAVTGIGKAHERQKVSKQGRAGPGSGCVSPQPATPTTIPLVAALPVVEPMTPLILVEAELPFHVGASTPLPATPDNPTAFAPATGPAAPAKPWGNLGWGRFPGPAAQSVTPYYSAGRRIAGEGSEPPWTHWVPGLRSEGEHIGLSLSAEPQPSKLKKICCPYCEASTHIALDDCWDFN